MDHRREIRISKLLSYVLRHRPDSIGITLDGAGWAVIGELLTACAHTELPFTREELDHVVARNPEQRFILDESGSRIRAQYGHSVAVDLGYAPTEPPQTLFHGTACEHVSSIRQNGLTSQRRRHVHLSPTREAAARVGRRHGPSQVLEVEAQRMFKDGLQFFQAPNGIWLTDRVPSAYLRFQAEQTRPPKP